MNVSPDRRWEGFVDEAVSAGRYPSADAVVEAMRRSLRDHIQAAIAEGGEVSEEELERAIDEHTDELRRNCVAD